MAVVLAIDGAVADKGSTPYPGAMPVRCRCRRDRESDRAEGAMPSLLRFLTVLAILAGAVYGSMVALVNYVQPQPREMTVKIPPTKLQLPN
jgi:hypothetical protein